MKILKKLYLYGLLGLCSGLFAQDHHQYYDVLKLSYDASLEEIEKAYYIHTALCHKQLQNFHPYETIEEQGFILKLYGRYGYIENHNSYRYDFIGSSSSRNRVSALRKCINDIRHAYEVLTGHTLDKVQLSKKELDTYDLPQEIMYHEIANRKIRDLPKYVQKQRKLYTTKEPLIADDQNDYFVFGELYQDMSLLSDTDKAKAEQYVSLEKKEEIQAWIKNYENYQLYKGITVIVGACAVCVGGYLILDTVTKWRKNQQKA